MPHDLPPLLRSIDLTPGYRATCWVSCYCFLPTALADGGIAALVASAGAKLRVFRQTVLRHVDTAPAAGVQTTQIVSATAVQRTPTSASIYDCPDHPGYGAQLSKVLSDWYSPQPSAAFEKTQLRFNAGTWLDTSYNGELLVLTGAPYLQGIDEQFDGDVRGATQAVGNDTIGQSFTMTYQVHLYVRYRSTAVHQHCFLECSALHCTLHFNLSLPVMLMARSGTTTRLIRPPRTYFHRLCRSLGSSLIPFAPHRRSTRLVIA